MLLDVRDFEDGGMVVKLDNDQIKELVKGPVDPAIAYSAKLQVMYDAAYNASNTPLFEAIGSVCQELGLDIDVSGKLQE